MQSLKNNKAAGVDGVVAEVDAVTVEVRAVEQQTFLELEVFVAFVGNLLGCFD